MDRAKTAADLVMRIDSERRRAIRAAAIARKHDVLVGQDMALRELHERQGAMYWQLERRHLVTLGLYESLLTRIRRTDSGGSVRGPSASALLSVTAQIAGSTGAIMELVGTRRSETVCLASDPVAERAYEVEFTAGEGPSHDAVRSRRPVTAADRELSDRWHAYGPAVTMLRVRAVAAIPLERGLPCLGALTLLNPPASAHAVIADLGEALIGTLIDGYLSPESSLDAASDQMTVQQAAGMISARHDCPVDDALAMIRARAFADGTTAAMVADGIVHRGQDL